MSEQRLEQKSESVVQPVFFRENEAVRQLRVSEWLPEPPAPPSLVKRVRRLPWATIRAVFYLACIGGGLLLILFLTKVYLFAFGGVLPGLFGAVWYKARYRGGSEAVRDLMDFPAAVEQFPVEVAYLRDGTQYGSDLGVASFEGGSLHFQGRRSWFDFASSDTFSRAWDISGRKELDGFRRYSLKAREDSDSSQYRAAPGWEVRLVPLDEIQKGEAGYRARFHTAIRTWMRPDETRRWSSVLPPATPLAETVAAAERGLLAKRVLFVVLLGGLAGAYATYQVWFGDSTFPMVAFAALLILIGFFGLKLRCAARQVNDLHRLAQPPEG